MIGSIVQVFQDFGNCFLVAGAVALGMFLFYRGQTVCDKTVGIITGGARCDSLKKALSAACTACMALVLINMLIGGRRGAMY